MVRIELKGDDLKRAAACLDYVKDGVPRAMRNAINRTLITVRSEATKAVRAEINLKMADVRGTFRIVNATIANLTGEVISTGRKVPLIRFGPKPSEPKGKRPPVGVSVLVRKSEGRKTIGGSFIARMGSGHKGVFTRTGPERFPIRELYGPAVPDVLGAEPTHSEVEGMAQRRLEERFWHEVNFLLSKAAGK